MRRVDRWRQLPLLAVALLTAVLAATPLPSKAHEQTSDIRVTAEPASFTRLGNGRFGKLEYRGGVILSSDDDRFGGFSGLAISADGRAILAVSDEGWWLKANVIYRNDRLVDVSQAQLRPVLDRKGRRSKSKRSRDAEDRAIGQADPTNSIETGLDRSLSG